MTQAKEVTLRKAKPVGTKSFLSVLRGFYGSWAPYVHFHNIGLASGLKCKQTSEPVHLFLYIRQPRCN